MQATIRAGCGVTGIPRYAAGSALKLSPYISPEGETVAGLFRDEFGTIWPVSQVVLAPDVESCPECDKPLLRREGSVGPFALVVSCCPYCMYEEVRK